MAQSNDPSDAAIGGATVTVKSIQTNQARSATTDHDGTYTFALLPVGQYSIGVEAPGFKPYQREGIELQVEEKLRVDFSSR